MTDECKFQSVQQLFDNVYKPIEKRTDIFSLLFDLSKAFDTGLDGI